MADHDWITALGVDAGRDERVARVLSRFGDLAEYWSSRGASACEDDSATAAWVVARLTEGERGVTRLRGLLWREIEGVRAFVDEHPITAAQQHFDDARQCARLIDESPLDERLELARYASSSVAALDQTMRSVGEQTGVPTSPATRSNFGVTVRRCFKLVDGDHHPTLVPELMVSPEHLRRERAALLDAVHGYERQRAYPSLEAAWSDSQDPRSLVLAGAGDLEDFSVRQSVVRVCQKCVREIVMSDCVLGGELPREGIGELASQHDASRLAEFEAAALGARALASLGQAMGGVRTPAQVPVQVRVIVLAQYALQAAEALSWALARERALGGDHIALAERWAALVRADLRARGLQGV